MPTRITRSFVTLAAPARAAPAPVPDILRPLLTRLRPTTITAIAAGAVIHRRSTLDSMEGSTAAGASVGEAPFSDAVVSGVKWELFRRWDANNIIRPRPSPGHREGGAPAGFSLSALSSESQSLRP